MTIASWASCLSSVPNLAQVCGCAKVAECTCICPASVPIARACDAPRVVKATDVAASGKTRVAMQSHAAGPSSAAPCQILTCSDNVRKVSVYKAKPNWSHTARSLTCLSREAVAKIDPSNDQAQSQMILACAFCSPDTRTYLSPSPDCRSKMCQERSLDTDSMKRSSGEKAILVMVSECPAKSDGT